MTKDKASSGNISLVKNAARDKDGKRQGNFSLVDQSINALAAEIGFDAYCIYHFLLNNAGGKFWYTAKALASVFKKDQLSEDRIKRAIKKLCKAGLLEKEKLCYEGQRPLYSYHVYEVSTKAAKTTKEQDSRQQLSTVATCKRIDNSDFSVDEIEQAAAGTKSCCTDSRGKPQPPAPPPITQANKARVKQGNTAPAASSLITEQAQAREQHIFDICHDNGAFSQLAKKKVKDCCTMWKNEKHCPANDRLIGTFATHFANDSGQDAATVYRQVVRL